MDFPHPQLKIMHCPQCMKIKPKEGKERKVTPQGTSLRFLKTAEFANYTSKWLLPTFMHFLIAPINLQNKINKIK